MKLKPKKCHHCSLKFSPKRSSLEIACSTKCAIELSRKKIVDDKVKAMKENLKGRSFYIGLLRAAFNTYIRMRDKDEPCISCGTRANVNYDAGHWLPAGNYSYLRFNEDNVNKQCSKNCNKEKHGNIHEYRIGLIKKIGHFRVEKLEVDRHKKLDLSIPELQEKIKHYKQLTKSLKNQL